MVAAFDEASRDGRVTLEEGSEVLMETLNLQLTPADMRQLGKNRDSNIDGILTPTELFPGSISAGPGTADENREDGGVASSVSFVVSRWLFCFTLLCKPLGMDAVCVGAWLCVCWVGKSGYPDIDPVVRWAR